MNVMKLYFSSSYAAIVCLCYKIFTAVIVAVSPQAGVITISIHVHFSQILMVKARSLPEWRHLRELRSHPCSWPCLQMSYLGRSKWQLQTL